MPPLTPSGENRNTPKVPLMRDRRAQIADLVRQQRTVRVPDLAARFHVSEVTIRSDLAQLEREGLVLRDRGGAVANTSNIGNMLIAFEQRVELHTEIKQRIGAAAAQLVVPGDTILLDAGTTVVTMARHLTHLSGLTVVTNALNVAAEVGHTPGVQTVMLGGSINYDTFSTLGPMVEQELGHMVVQKVFLAAQSVDAGLGVTDTSLEIAQVKRAMVKAGRQVILLADASKWSRPGFIRVVPFAQIDTVISDDRLPEATRTTLHQLGIHVLCVPADTP